MLEVSKARFWEEARRSGHSVVESPFTFASAPGVMVAGVIDLLFGSDRDWRIIDYKTDAQPSTRMAAYDQQLKMYEAALASVGVPNVTTTIQRVRETNELPWPRHQAHRCSARVVPADPEKRSRSMVAPGMRLVRDRGRHGRLHRPVQAGFR